MRSHRFERQVFFSPIRAYLRRHVQTVETVIGDGHPMLKHYGSCA